MEEALQGGAHLALLTSTCSSPRENIVESALALLGQDLSEQVRIFQCPQTSSADADSPAPDDISSLEKSLHKAAAEVGYHFITCIAADLQECICRYVHACQAWSCLRMQE